MIKFVICYISNFPKMVLSYNLCKLYDQDQHVSFKKPACYQNAAQGHKPYYLGVKLAKTRLANQQTKQIISSPIFIWI